MMEVGLLKDLVLAGGTFFFFFRHIMRIENPNSLLASSTESMEKLKGMFGHSFLFFFFSKIGICTVLKI